MTKSIVWFLSTVRQPTSNNMQPFVILFCLAALVAISAAQLRKPPPFSPYHRKEDSLDDSSFNGNHDQHGHQYLGPYEHQGAFQDNKLPYGCFYIEDGSVICTPL